MNNAIPFTVLLVLLAMGVVALAGERDTPPEGWRSLPLVEGGKVHPNWAHVGYGGFVAVDGGLRTECSEKGLGLLLYRAEKFGDCRIRVVYRSQDAKSNSGVFVRIDDGILSKLDENHTPATRDQQGNLTKESLSIFKEASEKELGPWYAVHHGYEIQICDAGDRFHRTGAVYSLAPSAAAIDKPPTDWKTMVITLDGPRVLVDVDGRRQTVFDPQGKDVPAEGEWYEPKRGPSRPASGYLGLQNHDPGDVVFFKEVSVQPLERAK